MSSNTLGEAQLVGEAEDGAGVQDEDDGEADDVLGTSGSYGTTAGSRTAPGRTPLPTASTIERGWTRIELQRATMADPKGGNLGGGGWEKEDGARA